MHEETNPKGILLPALLAGVATLLLALAYMPSGRVRGLGMVAYVIIGFGIGFIFGAGIAYLVRQLYRVTKRD
jgi:hypothetical protein